MPNFSARFYLSLGQTGLLISIILVAIFIGLVPDQTSQIRTGRAALAEALATNASSMRSELDIKNIESTLKLVIKRNPDLLSAALRGSGANPLVVVGPHEAFWSSMPGKFSTDAQVRVPIWAKGRPWGQMELRFRPLEHSGDFGFLYNPWVQLIVFISVMSFLSFYLYLGRMLKELNPSQAIPGRVRSALDTMAEGLMVLDAKGRIVLANQAFADLLKRDPDQLIGEDVEALPWRDAAGDELHAEDNPWRSALASGQVRKEEIVKLELPEVGTRTFLTNASPVMNTSGKSGGVLVSLDDITPLEEKEELLRQSREEAVQANQAKSDFLANMSHEIRTPMNAILGFTEVLKRGWGADEHSSRKYLNTIHSSGTHLLGLINDILDLSKVEAGRMEVERLDIEPYPIILEVLKILGVKAREKGITLDFQALGPVPKTILSDGVRIRQIVTNLVGNAIKFTAEGGITVSTYLHSDGMTPMLGIDVKDSGVGMTAEGAAKIFDPFSQADSSVTRKFGGTGLGLSISKKFAEALGGGITVRSAPGEGSTFSVMLDIGPIEELEFLDPSEVGSVVDEQEQSGPTHWQFPAARILVVDDGEENRDLLKLVLEELGLTVDEARNGQEGLEMSLDQDYDAVLMDVQMPVMDGFTAVGRMREADMQRPVVALTANAMKGYEQQCLDAGYSGYQSKPINIDKLQAYLAELLGAEAVPAAEVGEEPKGDVLEGPRTQDAVEDDLLADPVVREIANRFLDKLAGNLEDMQRELIGNELEALARLAHHLKGTAGSVGYGEFTVPAEELEAAARAGDAALVRQRLEMVVGIGVEVLDRNGRPPVADVMDTELEGWRKEAPPDHRPIVSRLATDRRFHGPIGKFIARLNDQLPDMQAALAATDFEALAGAAHWLKGAGGTVGFDILSEAALALEASARAADSQGAAANLLSLEGLAARLVVEAPAAGSGELAANPVAGVPDKAPVAVDGAGPIASRLAVNARFWPAIQKFSLRLADKMNAMDTMLAQGEYDELAGLAHWLKGAAGTVGYDQFTEPAIRLEEAARSVAQAEAGAAMLELHALVGRIDIPGDAG